MKIVYKNIETLHPYENNPRKNDDAVEALAQAIQKFGWKQPIVIDKDNVIVAGHTRYKAAKRLQLQTIPCVIADDLTDEEVRAYRLADNKIAELSGWDFEKLSEELDSIINIDMTNFGFDNLSGLSEEIIAEFPEIDEEKPCKNKCPVCGYQVSARLINEKWLGVPESRERVIFIGVRNDLDLLPVFPKPLTEQIPLGVALKEVENSPDEEKCCWTRRNGTTK